MNRLIGLMFFKLVAMFAVAQLVDVFIRKEAEKLNNK